MKIDPDMIKHNQNHHFFYLAILVVVSRKFCLAPLKSRPTDKKSLWNSLVNLEDRFKVEKVQTLSLT